MTEQTQPLEKYRPTMGLEVLHYWAADAQALIQSQRAEIERLRAVAVAARVYFDHYMQDEAADADDCVCGQEQHERAVALRDALISFERKCP